MAQWYNGVFYTDKDEPKKDDEFIPHSIPRIREYDENIEDIALQTKFDFAFVEKFSFKGLPQDFKGQQEFLKRTSTLAREMNPAGLIEKTQVLASQQNFLAATKNAAVSGLSFIPKLTYKLGNWALSTDVELKKGGRKTKKTRPQKNQKRTQRRLLAVDDR